MPLKFRAAARIPGFSLGANFSRIGGLVALVDTIYLLNRGRGGLLVGMDPENRQSLNPCNLSLPVLRYDLVKIVPGLMRELSFSQRSFGRLGLKLIHRMTDNYVVKATGFGPLLSERSVAIIWNTLMLSGPILPKFALIPVNLSLPRYCRIN